MSESGTSGMRYPSMSSNWPTLASVRPSTSDTSGMPESCNCCDAMPAGGGRGAGSSSLTRQCAANEQQVAALVDA
eukprot:3348224-Alexandrium_andersonii.AAC.1